MSWAQRRKATYTLSILSILILLLLGVAFLFFNKRPTCFDGIQNQGEQGIDCGGPCTLLCRAAYADPYVLWVQWSKVSSSGTYSVLAYAENPNVGVGANNVPYSFKIYDQNNILLYSASGTTDIPPSSNFAVFTDGINIKDKVPARIDFEFSNSFTWQKVPDIASGISVVSQSLVNADTTPKLLATIKNTSADAISNIQSVAILYDTNGNAIAFSKTITDSLAPGASADIAFTWPEPFAGDIKKIDIVSQILQN